MGTLSPSHWAGALKREWLLYHLADLLEEHIRFEERQLFYHLQDYISVVDLEKIESRFSNNSKSIDEKWEDVFWEVKQN